MRAGVVLGSAVLVIFVAAGCWYVVRGGNFLDAWGIALLASAGLLSITSGGYADRLNGVSYSSVLLEGGKLSTRDDVPLAGLTGTGVALLVGLPLFLAGGLLLGL